MPRKPLKPCRYPGCPKLVETRYCEEHAKQVASDYEKYDRDPKVRARYSGAWKKIRSRFIAEHPLCELCQRQGRITCANEVHHILPLSRGGTHRQDNLMSLCTSCHSSITAKDGDRWRRRR